MIYTKTALGRAALQNHASLLPRQRSAFILFDGKRNLNDIMAATGGLGVTSDDLKYLIETGLLAPLVTVPLPATAPNAAVVADLNRFEPGTPVGAAQASSVATSAQAHYLRAYPIAIRLTASLGLRGFRLNLAVEAAASVEQLRELAPRIREAVGPDKYQDLDDALFD